MNINFVFYMMNKKISTLIVFSLIALMSSAQNQKVLVYDLVHKTIDSFPIPNYNATIPTAKTTGNIGSHNNQIASLERNLPTSFKYPNADYSLKIRVSKNHDITDYPFRTTAKLFKANSDTTVGQCSGNMISPWHYLSAAHCFKSPYNPLNPWNDTLLSDSFFISPAFDNGSSNPAFGQSAVAKIFFLKKYKVNGEDLVICELAEPIGYKTGWVGYGFSKDDSAITNHMNYKFAYPGFQFALDTFNFNGDSLYYYYGKVNELDTTFIGVKSGRAIPGESGSSILVSPNNNEFTSYGALTYSFNQKNSRINNYEFYLFQSIIENKLTTVENLKVNSPFKIFPNPTQGIVKIKGDIGHASMYLINPMGQKIPIQLENAMLDMTNIAGGVYTLIIKDAEKSYVHKIVRL